MLRKILKKNCTGTYPYTISINIPQAWEKQIALFEAYKSNCYHELPIVGNLKLRQSTRSQ